MKLIGTAGFIFFVALAVTPSLQADDLDWQVELAEHSHNLSKSDETLAVLVGAHERVVVSRCMPVLLKELRHSTPPPDPTCTTALERLVRLDPENPVALCAAKGIDSPECRARFRLQRVRAVETLHTSGSDLEQKLESSRNAPRIEELRRTIAEAQLAIQGTEVPPAALRALRSLRRQLLDATCRVTALRFEGSMQPTPAPVGSLLSPPETVPGTPAPEKPIKEASPAGPMEELLAKLAPTAPAKAAPTPLPQTHERIRLLTMVCARTIEEVLKAEPTSSAAICYRDGFVNPSCIDALRRDKRLFTDKKAPPGTNQKDTGFSNF